MSAHCCNDCWWRLIKRKLKQNIQHESEKIWKFENLKCFQKIQFCFQNFPFLGSTIFHIPISCYILTWNKQFFLKISPNDSSKSVSQTYYENRSRLGIFLKISGKSKWPLGCLRWSKELDISRVCGLDTDRRFVLIAQAYKIPILYVTEVVYCICMMHHLRLRSHSQHTYKNIVQVKPAQSILILSLTRQRSIIFNTIIIAVIYELQLVT